MLTNPVKNVIIWKDEIVSDKMLYTVDDIREIFQIGRTKAYQLMVSDGFPSFRLNKKLYVSSEKLSEWINKNTRKTYKF